MDAWVFHDSLSIEKCDRINLLTRLPAVDSRDAVQLRAECGRWLKLDLSTYSVARDAGRGIIVLVPPSFVATAGPPSERFVKVSTTQRYWG